MTHESRQSGHRALPKYLEPGEWSRVLATVDSRTPTGRRDMALYLLLWRTGMRIGEALNLTSADFDRRTGRIRLPKDGRAGSDTVYAPVDAPRMAEALDAWDRQRAEWDPSRESPYYFITKHRGPVNPEQVRQTLRRRGKKAGIPETVTPHMFRHSFAVELLQEGYDLRQVQDALRHADVSTTQVYMHLVPNHRERLMKGRTEF